MLLLMLLLRCVCVCCCLQGSQLIELLRKNPAVSIPVVIQRLEQKEGEWLKVSRRGGWSWLLCYVSSAGSSHHLGSACAGIGLQAGARMFHSFTHTHALCLLLTSVKQRDKPKPNPLHCWLLPLTLTPPGA